MESLTQVANCIGLSGNISILRDFMGFFRGRVPPDPTGGKITISLLEQIQRLKNPHFHLNVIEIGVDNFTDTEDIVIDYSIYKIRNIYAQVGVGVGRVQFYGVPSAQAGGLDRPTTESQLETITHRWVVRNDGIDVFVPFAMNVVSNGNSILGLSPEGGPCEDKDDKGMDGSVVGLFGSEQTARSFAHEVGHYLDLGHENDDSNNLMCQSSKAKSIRNSVQLTSDQGEEIKEHCLVKSGC